VSDHRENIRGRSDGAIAPRRAESADPLVAGVRCIAILCVLAVQWRACRMRRPGATRLASVDRMHWQSDPRRSELVIAATAAAAGDRPGESRTVVASDRPVTVKPRQPEVAPAPLVPTL
jgi:hypothetical protein